MDGLIIRKGREEDLDYISKLYDDLNDYLASKDKYNSWKKGVYPVREDAELGLKEGSLFVAFYGDEIVGTMKLRQVSDKEYALVNWKEDLSDNEIFVLHTFLTSPKYMKLGIGKKMLEYAFKYAKENNKKAIRLDVYEGNIPAINLYEAMGFTFVGRLNFGTERHGLDWYSMYEKTF